MARRPTFLTPFLGTIPVRTGFASPFLADAGNLFNTIGCTVSTMNRVERQNLWQKLLSSERLYGKRFSQTDDSRSEYQRDYDRIVFSSAFRRLQDKTQVFPLSQSDYTRTRLTHSLETSSVGRTLGIQAGKYLQRTGVHCNPYDIGNVVATAALAHDLGNPPFGHSGESAIQSWAKRKIPAPSPDYQTVPVDRVRFFSRRKSAPTVPMTPAEIADVHLFEGNAQSFRILARTWARTRKGGMRPTLATLGALAKYPRPSMAGDFAFDENNAAQKKPGYFQNDRLMAHKAYRAVGMKELSPGVFVRHPLSFLTEAADDVCYAIADLEDALKLKIVSFNDVRDVMIPLACQDAGFSEPEYLDDAARLARIRASTLAVLVHACTGAFRDNLSSLEEGSLCEALIKRTSVWGHYQGLTGLAKAKVYSNERVLQLEYAGYQTIGGLLEMFHEAICDTTATRDHKKADKLLRLLPSEIIWQEGHAARLQASGHDPFSFYLGLMTPYERLLAITDYVSGMTDRFAIQLYQRLTGIRLPD
jgi:dGTPase